MVHRNSRFRCERRRHASIEDSLALDLVEGADAQDRERPRVRSAARRLEACRFDAAVDDDDLAGDVGTGFRHDHIAVIRGDGDDEGRFPHLFAKHAPVDVQIRAMRCEAERDVRQAMDDESCESRMACEVAVNVAHPALFHEPGRMGDLREDRDRAGEEVQAAERSAQHVREHPEVPAGTLSEKEQLGAEDRKRDEGQVVRPFDERLRSGVDVPGALAQERVELDLHAAVLDRDDLVQDERLAELGEAGHHVGDGRTRRRASAVNNVPRAVRGRGPRLADRSCHALPGLRPRRPQSPDRSCGLENVRSRCSLTDDGPLACAFASAGWAASAVAAIA